MAERSLRGMSIGAKSLESDDTSISPHETMWRMYARRATAPSCRLPRVPKSRTSGSAVAVPVAHREGDADREGDEISKPTRTHWDMLLERRSEEELATLLEKRLQMHRDGWIPDYE